MTREEKFKLLNELLEYEENNDIGNLTRAERREFQQWISKALEQESVLDEIRTEIDNTLSDGMIHKKTVLGIIDKCKEDTAINTLNEESVLDKIRAKIMQLDYDIDTVDYDQDDMTYSEDVHTIHREEVLQILDEYEGKNVQHDHKKETCLSDNTPTTIGPDPFETTIEEDREAE